MPRLTRLVSLAILATLTTTAASIAGPAYAATAASCGWRTAQHVDMYNGSLKEGWVELYVDGCGHANAQVHGPINESYYISIYSRTKTYDTYYNPHGSGAYTVSVSVGADQVAAYGALYDFVTGVNIDQGATGYHSAK